MDINKELKRIKGLTQYKNKTEEELREIATNLAKKHSIYIKTSFSNKEDRKLAKELINKYLEEYSIETIADKGSLKQLIELEVLHRTLYDVLDKLDRKGKVIPPSKLIEDIHRNLTQIIILKDQLGLSKDKDEATKNDAYKALELLKKKFKKWREENQASRTLICPFCGKMIMLKIKTDIWEAQKHPFFSDRILSNKHLIKLYKDNKITKEDVSLILETSEDYTDWLVKKWNIKASPSQITGEKKEEVVNEKGRSKEGVSASREGAEGETVQ